VLLSRDSTGWTVSRTFNHAYTRPHAGGIVCCSTRSVSYSPEIIVKDDRVGQHGGLIQLGLAGKTGIITGGSMGIGKVSALALAQEGARVAICAGGIEAWQESASEFHAPATRSYSLGQT
jgi:hypothetical protein